MADLRNKLKTASFRNQSLQDILKSCSVAIELISVEPYTGAIHNTKMTLKLNRGDNYPIQERYYERIHFYNRLDLKDVLPSGLLLPIENVSETLDILNVEQQGDFEREDLIFNEFDIEAHPDSLGYIGRVATFPWTIKYRVISTGKIAIDNNGVNDILIKPILEEELISKIIDIFLNQKHIEDIESFNELLNKNIITSTTNLSGKILYVSDAFCKISGYERSELIGKNHNIVRHPDMPSSIYKDMWDTITAGLV
jgi:PAS domain-containing protein